MVYTFRPNPFHPLRICKYPSSARTRIPRRCSRRSFTIKLPKMADSTQVMRIGVVQFDPKIGKVQENILKAQDLCSKIEPNSVDLICFPEMAFTGYMFRSAAEIEPYLELPNEGPTSRFCSDLAKRLECFVVAGYAERLSARELKDSEYDSTPLNPYKERIGANSAMFYAPDGDWIGNYRKTNLFPTDETWAKPGGGFISYKLPGPLRILTLGICMDLNPQNSPEWNLREGPYEIADYCSAKGTNVLIMLNSWLDSGHEPESKHDHETLRYWGARLRPLWDDDEDPDGYTELHKVPGEEDPETVVVLCNRTGTENGSTFAGTSAVFRMRLGTGKPKLLDMMERKEEGVRIWNISVK